jgi:Holliday junction resolvasome RuvABC ATP-dependent DNA helicase subunit
MDNKNIIIDNKFKGGPLTICFVAVSESSETIEEVYEPFYSHRKDLL